MHGDYKTGLAIGAALTVISAIWLSAKGTRTSAMPAEGPIELQTFGQTANNVEGHPPGDDADGFAYSAASATSITTIHIVQKDETLSQISERYYDSPDQWRRIFEANSDKVISPDRLKPGTRLVIPD